MTQVGAWDNCKICESLSENTKAFSAQIYIELGQQTKSISCFPLRTTFTKLLTDGLAANS